MINHLEWKEKILKDIDKLEANLKEIEGISFSKKKKKKQFQEQKIIEKIANITLKKKMR